MIHDSFHVVLLVKCVLETDVAWGPFAADADLVLPGFLPTMLFCGKNKVRTPLRELLEAEVWTESVLLSLYLCVMVQICFIVRFSPICVQHV